MDFTSLIIGIPFFLIGMICVLFAHRFGRSLVISCFENKVPPFSNMSQYEGKTREEFETMFFDKWPHRGFWLLWLWGIRILGAMLALGGATLILLFINIL